MYSWQSCARSAGFLFGAILVAVAPARADQGSIRTEGRAIYEASTRVAIPDPAKVASSALVSGGTPRLDWSEEYQDPPVGKGVEHAWCRMVTQDPESLSPIRLKGLDRVVRAQAGKFLQVSLKPDVSFSVQPRPYAYGEVEPNLTARASFDVSLSWKGVVPEVDVIHGVLEVQARRCGLRAGLSELRVFGQKVQAPGVVPQVDSDDPASPVRAAAAECQAAFRRYLLSADQRKKAFRDAHQIAWQYRQTPNLDFAPLCEAMAEAAPRMGHFMGGPKCYSNEPLGAIIERFKDKAFSADHGLLAARRILVEATARFDEAVDKELDRDFSGKPRKATKVLGTIPLMMNALPLSLRLTLNLVYSLPGRIETAAKFPSGLGVKTMDPDRLIRVKVKATPTVSATVSAALVLGGPGPGVDGDTEGTVTLVQASLPLLIDVALERQAFPDERSLPADLRPPLSRDGIASLAGAPQRYRFSVAHEHGASVDAETLLAGRLTSRLRMGDRSTVRQPVIDLRGAPARVDLVDADPDSGQRADRPDQPLLFDGEPPWAPRIVRGSNPIGVSESEYPFVGLGFFRDRRRASGEPAVSFDFTAVDHLFYDDLCRLRIGQACKRELRAPPCPIHSECDAMPGSTEGVCRAICRKENVACASDGECCAGLLCDWLKQCRACVPKLNACSRFTKCCPGLSCDPLTGLCQTAN